MQGTFTLHYLFYQKGQEEPAKQGNQNNRNNVHDKTSSHHLFYFDMTACKCNCIGRSAHRHHAGATGSKRHSNAEL